MYNDQSYWENKRVLWTLKQTITTYKVDHTIFHLCIPVRIRIVTNNFVNVSVWNQMEKTLQDITMKEYSVLMIHCCILYSSYFRSVTPVKRIIVYIL